jgi:hypothetical protein
VQLAEEPRLADIAEDVIGQMLAGSPEGADGIWPVVAVRNLLDQPASDTLASGFVVGVLNNERFTVRGAFTGGAQERTRVQKLDRHAEAMVARWPRTAEVLREAADSLRARGHHEDDRASDSQDEF